MSKIWENPCESPSFGDWDSKTEVGDSTIIQTADAAWPGRGGLGLRFTTVGSDSCYLQKDLSVALNPGDWIYFGFWACVKIPPSTSRTSLASISSPAWSNIGLLYFGLIGVGVNMVDDSGVWNFTGYVSELVVDQWEYVVMAFKRATGAASNDGESKLFRNNIEIADVSGVDNYNKLATIGGFRQSLYNAAIDGTQVDFDEQKITINQYPEPFVPKPRIFV